MKTSLTSITNDELVTVTGGNELPVQFLRQAWCDNRYGNEHNAGYGATGRRCYSFAKPFGRTRRGPSEKELLKFAAEKFPGGQLPPGTGDRD